MTTCHREKPAVSRETMAAASVEMTGKVFIAMTARSKRPTHSDCQIVKQNAILLYNPSKVGGVCEAMRSQMAAFGHLSRFVTCSSHEQNCTISDSWNNI
jgi:hypothetical protein